MTKNRIVYRLRNYGYRIDAKNKEIFLTKDNKHKKLVDRLVSEFGFSVSTSLFEDKEKGRVLILKSYENLFARQCLVNTLRNQGYIPVIIPKKRNDIIKMLERCDIVFVPHDWLNEESLLLISVAKYLGKTIIFQQK